MIYWAMWTQDPDGAFGQFESSIPQSSWKARIKILTRCSQICALDHSTELNDSFLAFGRVILSLLMIEFAIFAGYAQIFFSSNALPEMQIIVQVRGWISITTLGPIVQSRWTTPIDLLFYHPLAPFCPYGVAPYGVAAPALFHVFAWPPLP